MRAKERQTLGSGNQRIFLWLFGRCQVKAICFSVFLDLCDSCMSEYMLSLISCMHLLGLGLDLRNSLHQIKCTRDYTRVAELPKKKQWLILNDTWLFSYNLILQHLLSSQVRWWWSSQVWYSLFYLSLNRMLSLAVTKLPFILFAYFVNDKIWNHWQP